MSDELNWDAVLGGVEEDEKENPSSSGDFEALPAGPYSVVVQEAEKQTSKTGNDMIKVRVQVTEGPYANRVLFNYIVFSTGNPRAMRMTLERLAAFGLTREFIATTKPSIANLADMLVGRKATAVVAIQKEGDYAGRNEIKSFRALEGVAQPAPTVPAEAKPAGVPSIPTPAPTQTPDQAAAPAVPNIPTPSVPAGGEDPFG